MQFFDVETAKGTCNIPENIELSSTALQASTVAARRPRPVYKFDGVNETQTLENGQKLSHGECPPGPYHLPISKLGKRKAAYTEQMETISPLAALTPTSAGYANVRNIRPRLSTPEDWERSNGLGTSIKSLLTPKQELKTEPFAGMPAANEAAIEACGESHTRDQQHNSAAVAVGLQHDLPPPPPPPPLPSLPPQASQPHAMPHVQAQHVEGHACGTPDVPRTGDEASLGESLELGVDALESCNTPNTPNTTTATNNTNNNSNSSTSPGRRRRRVARLNLTTPTPTPPPLAPAPPGAAHPTTTTTTTTTTTMHYPSPTLAGPGLETGMGCGGGVYHLPRCGSGGGESGGGVGGWSPPWQELSDRDGGFSTPLTPFFYVDAVSTGALAGGLRSPGGGNANALLPLTPRAFGLEFLRGPRAAAGVAGGSGSGGNVEEEGASAAGVGVGVQGEAGAEGAGEEGKNGVGGGRSLA